MQTGSTIYVNLPCRSHIDTNGCNIRVFRQLEIAYRALIPMHELVPVVVGRNRSEGMGANGVERISAGMGMKELNSINV